MSMIKKILQLPFFIKLFNWEYWPFAVVYSPIYFYWVLLGIRNKSFFFFNTANPTIKNGGFLMESKKEIYDLLPSGYYPRTLLFKNDNNAAGILAQVTENNFTYPLIGKPDIGMQGIAVKKLETETDVIAYAKSSQVDFLIQEFIHLENEVGIFYYRYPGETKGHISGIVSKEFLSVTGDGIATVEELLQRDQRFILQIPFLKATSSTVLQQVLSKGEIKLLVPYGNHARGAKFIDASHLINEKSEAAIDTICKQVNGFYFGRIDLRYNTWEELEQGKNISIIELNGAGSEPTHMYDPKHSVFYAWKEIIRHWKILAKISRINHRQMQIPYMRFAEAKKMFGDNRNYVKLIRAQHNSKETKPETTVHFQLPDILFT
ncbi:D-alanine--D-alanine ligase [Ferruginibacter profundus]